MKLALILLLSPLTLLAQEKMEAKSYVTTYGWEITKGDTLQLLSGSQSTGDFQYIHRGPDDLNAEYANQAFVVQKIYKVKDKYGNVLSSYFLASSKDAGKYQVEIDDAIQAKEIKLPDGYTLEVPVQGGNKVTYRNFIVLSTGDTVRVGEKLKVGTGSMPDADFKFIRTNAASLFAYYSTTGYQGLANQANAFSRSASGLTFKVIRIDRRGSEKNGYVYYPIISTGMVRYEVDIENAINSGEVILASKRAKVNAASTSGLSVADELRKLNELRKEGIITEDEFQKQKERLLN